MPNATLLVLTNTAALEDWELAALPAAIAAQRAPSVRSRKGEAFKGGPPLPPTLLRRVAGVSLMLVMRALAGSLARTCKLEISW